jgi:hypothetical protein
VGRALIQSSAFQQLGDIGVDAPVRLQRPAVNALQSTGPKSAAAGRDAHLGADPNSPFARDASDKFVRRSYWLDMADSILVLVMTNGIGAHLSNDEKRAHLSDLKRAHLVDQVCVQEILPPDDIDRR